jgi:hypothetical protein
MKNSILSGVPLKGDHRGSWGLFFRAKTQLNIISSNFKFRFYKASDFNNLQSKDWFAFAQKLSVGTFDCWNYLHFTD